MTVLHEADQFILKGQPIRLIVHGTRWNDHIQNVKIELILQLVLN